MQADPIPTNYELLGVIAKGSFSVVYKALQKKTGIIRCIKKISKKNFTIDILHAQHEVQILQKLVHPNIVRIIEYYEDQKNLFIVTEYLEGGELFDKMLKKMSFSEFEARTIISQVISAILYLHQQNILHRDLKPQNIIFEYEDPAKLNVKIIDFGTSRRIFKNQKLSFKTGTYSFMAPEVLTHKYDQKCDIWNVGVILFLLLSGRHPFPGVSEEETLKKISTVEPHFHSEDWSDISSEAVDLIKQMLRKDPVQRPTAKELFQHPWFSKELRTDCSSLKERVAKNLGNFMTQNSLRNALRYYLVTYMDMKQEDEELHKAFKLVDRDNDGYISKEEWNEFIMQNA